MEKDVGDYQGAGAEALRQARVLLVGGIAEERHLLRNVFESQGVAVKEAASAGEALQLAAGFRPDATVIFPALPGGSVPDLCQKIRSDARLSWTAIVVLGSEAEETEAPACGPGLADDILRRPLSASDIVATVLNRIARLQGLHGQTIRDELTGCYTRGFLDERLAEELERYRRYGHVFSVVMCDLDDFKFVNDTYGHAVGDQVLREFGAFLRKVFRRSDVVARYGGEEFTILMPHTYGSLARKVVERVQDHWRKEAVIDPRTGRQVRVTFSAGVAEAGADGDAGDDLLDNADKALCAAKQAGKDRVVMAAGARAVPGEPGSSILVIGQGFIRQYLTGQLQKWGYRVYEATEKDALSVLRAESPGIVLLDLDAANEGALLVQAIRAAAPTVKILVMGRSRDKKVVLASYAGGADDFITRPFSVDELEASVLAVCPWEEGAICTRPFNLDGLRRRLLKLAARAL
ncbi:MAG: GGDEF domain-containing response regulator [Desulfotomaculales bacterium]